MNEPLLDPIKKTDTIISDNPYENYPSSSDEEWEDSDTGIIIISKKETKLDKCTQCMYGSARLLHKCIFNKCILWIYDCFVSCCLHKNNNRLIEKGYMKNFIA